MATNPVSNDTTKVNEPESKIRWILRDFLYNFSLEFSAALVLAAVSSIALLVWSICQATPAEWTQRKWEVAFGNVFYDDQSQPLENAEVSLFVDPEDPDTVRISGLPDGSLKVKITDFNEGPNSYQAETYCSETGVLVGADSKLVLTKHNLLVFICEDKIGDGRIYEIVFASDASHHSDNAVQLAATDFFSGRVPEFDSQNAID